MKSAPKTLQVFLPEGTPAGIQIAELTTRIVQAISVPRTHLKHFFERTESQYVGTYFLFGGEDDRSKPLAYVGQTEDLKQRLREHDAKKEFWTRAIILVSRTRSFTQAHIKWLEWHSITLATESKRFELKNGNSASKPFVTEAIQADLWEIFETGSLLLQSLGFPIFEPLIPKSSEAAKEETWHLNRSEADATATFTTEGMVVHKESICRRELTPSAKGTRIEKRREKMLEEGILQDNGQQIIFTEDFCFGFPSSAAEAIVGGSANGWVEWKNAEGKTLEEVNAATSPEEVKRNAATSPEA